jgi:hypothetical protein
MRDLPACNIVPQTTMLPCAPKYSGKGGKVELSQCLIKYHATKNKGCSAQNRLTDVNDSRLHITILLSSQCPCNSSTGNGQDLHSRGAQFQSWAGRAAILTDFSWIPSELAGKFRYRVARLRHDRVLPNLFHGQ